MVKKINKYAFAKSVLRRASRMWYANKEVEAKHRVSRGVYFCGICGGHFKKKDMEKDHINPVVNTEGKKADMNTFVENLFCDTENMQMLCIPCHDQKSQTEQQLRKIAKKKVKNETK